MSGMGEQRRQQADDVNDASAAAMRESAREAILQSNLTGGVALGLDIGGANLKAADSTGLAWTRPFALWRRPEAIADELAALMRDRPHAAEGAVTFDRIALTMTAELCDCFATKRDGVNAVLDAVAAAFPEVTIMVWLTSGEWVTSAEARRRPLEAAASNWHAMATWVAACWQEWGHEGAADPSESVDAAGEPDAAAILIDIGSTTTDVIPIGAGRVLAVGKTDTQRLASGELVYVGGRRTALMSLGPMIEFEGRSTRVMAEFFASSDDVMLVLGLIDEDGGDTDTADGRSRTKGFALARLLRMVGADGESSNPGAGEALAAAFLQRMAERIADAVKQVISTQADSGRMIETVIVSGSGRAIATEAMKVVDAALCASLPAARRAAFSVAREAAISAAGIQQGVRMRRETIEDVVGGGGHALAVSAAAAAVVALATEPRMQGA